MRLETTLNIKQEVQRHGFLPTTKLTSLNYSDDVNFMCGCGQSHQLNLLRNNVIGTALPIKFYIMTDCQCVSLIQVKGLFRIKCLTLWSCNANLFQEAANELDS